MQIHHNEIKNNLLMKMLEEKGIFAPSEYDKRWPLYLKNDVGAIGPDGIMAGDLRVTFFNFSK
jgi:hypothetical protein